MKNLYAGDRVRTLDGMWGEVVYIVEDVRFKVDKYGNVYDREILIEGFDGPISPTEFGDLVNMRFGKND